MYKNIHPQAMGLFCSQSELIELTLTHGFKGMHVDFSSFFETVTTQGIDSAIRFIKSAPIQITSTELPIVLDGDEKQFAAEMDRLPKVLDMICPLKCQCLVVELPAGSNTRPYHENFEIYRQRLAQVADAAAEFDMRVAINFSISGLDGRSFVHPFIQEPEAFVTLLKTCQSTHLGLVVDAWMWTVANGKFELLADVASDRIVDVRIADLPGDWNPNRISSADRLIYGSSRAVNGQQLLDVLTAAGYQGAVTPTAAASEYASIRSDAAVQKASESVDQFIAGTVEGEEESVDNASPDVASDASPNATAGAVGQSASV